MCYIPISRKRRHCSSLGTDVPLPSEKIFCGEGGVCTQASNAVVCYTAVFLGALRDDTKNGCVAD